jgi:hypothetical protein
MKASTRLALLLTLAATPLLAQTPAAPAVPTAPAADLAVKSAGVQGLEVRFINYHWQPGVMALMAKSPAEVKGLRRDWVMARLIVEPKPLKFGDTVLGTGSYAVSLFPNEGEGMVLELRKIDMREIYPRMNAFAPTPQGTPKYRGPAKFEPLEPRADRLFVTVTEEAGTIALDINYGDRRLPLKLTR